MRRGKLYINGGGSLIQDVTSRRSLWFYLHNISTAKHLGCKVQMYGCGIGPVSRPSHRKMAARVLNASVDVITLREPDSQAELKSMLRLNAAKKREYSMPVAIRSSITTPRGITLPFSPGRASGFRTGLPMYFPLGSATRILPSSAISLPRRYTCAIPPEVTKPS